MEVDGSTITDTEINYCNCLDYIFHLFTYRKQRNDITMETKQHCNLNNINYWINFCLRVITKKVKLN